MVYDITDENFRVEVLESDVPVLLDFYADWCGPCQKMGPIFEVLAEKYQGRVKFGRVDIQAQNGLRIKFFVGAVPRVTLVRGRKGLDLVDQLVTEEELIRRLDIVLTGQLDDTHCFTISSRKLPGLDW